MYASANTGFAVSRSREGAWIEIAGVTLCFHYVFCRSREGAWIEIGNGHESKQQLWCRSREGAWIEIAILTHSK